MSLFRVEGTKLKMDVEYVLMNEPFAKIYEAYDKDRVDKLFRYIYEISDNRSYSNKQGLNDKDAHTHALSTANLESTYKPDKLVIDAIRYYKRRNYSINADTLKELKQTLNLSKNINRKIKVALEDKLNKDTDLEASDISNLITLQGKLFDIINDLPNKIDTIKQLEVKVYRELEANKPIGRGGKQIPASYEGDPEIEGT